MKQKPFDPKDVIAEALKQTPKEVAISTLKITFSVRVTMDEKRVLLLENLIRSNANLGPVLVYKKEIIDGRTRYQSAINAEKQTLPVVYLPSSLTRQQLIAIAAVANMGGSEPPTENDLLLVIEQLLEQGVETGMIKKFIPLPPSFQSKLIQSVQSRLYNRKLAGAVDLITTSGKTMSQAAKLTGIPVKKLEAHLRKRSTAKPEQKLSRFSAAITKRYATLARANASVLSDVLEALSAGDISREEALRIFNIAEDTLRRFENNMQAWRRKFGEATNTKLTKRRKK